MIKRLRVKGFKSWRDTGDLALAPLTGLFGTNSSGKTSILQLILMLKQTVESADRKRVLHTGDDRSIVDLGTFFDLIYAHDTSNALQIGIIWQLLETLKVQDPQKKGRTLFEIDQMEFNVKIKEFGGTATVERFSYGFEDYDFGMKIADEGQKKIEYELISKTFQEIRYPGRPWPLPIPVKCYGFPPEVSGYYQNLGFLSDLVYEFEGFFGRIAYLGPLREYPKRTYTWAGEEPADVGMKGELAASAILAARQRGEYISPGYKRKRRTLEERIAYWFKEMGMIHSFTLRQIAKNRKDYELRVKKSATSPEVLITDVGFGVSQILPVLVLCYYVPEGSVILLEQPEIHLHPSVQAWLADVFIDVVKNRNVQIIVESHSEHLLRRLQRRIAEEQIKADQTALYFCRMDNSASEIEKLDIDMFGDIKNWPRGFFGDEMGELVAKTEAGIKRQMEG